MSQDSKIEWTDTTWNPVRGCVKVSPGCAHCYAETFAERFRGVKGHPYEQGFDLRLVPEKLTEPLSWKKPRRVFVNSMSDLFQDGVSDNYIDQVFAVMERTPQHTYQVLTKRAQRMFDYCSARHGIEAVSPLPNVWLGVSVENQHFADERIPVLLQTPAAIRFISAEPLLGPVDLWNVSNGWHNVLSGRDANSIHLIDEPRNALDWVIVGGESGPNARPFDIAWAHQLVWQCQQSGVACFVKQLGRDARDETKHNTMGHMLLNSRKGNDPSEWPKDLRVRQFPVPA